MDWIRNFRDFDREYRAHAVQKLIERDISFAEIDEATRNLEIIREYTDDTPYPSCLVLGFTSRKRPLHIVYSVNQSKRVVYVITIYEPDAGLWNKAFTRRNE